MGTGDAGGAGGHQGVKWQPDTGRRGANAGRAGVWHGLSTPTAHRVARQSGAEMAVYADPTSQSRIAGGVISKIDARSAVLEITEGSAPKTGFAVQTAPGLPPKVRFSAPLRADPDDGHTYGPLVDTLAQIADNRALDGVEQDAQPFDIGLVLNGARFGVDRG